MLSLTKWRPLRDISTLHKEVDDLFNRFFGREEWMPIHLFREEWYPRVESYVKDGNLVISAEIPGVDPKDVDISVVDNQLTIKGERKKKNEVKDDGYYLSEISYGSFERTIPLPESVNTDKIHAKYKDGVLEISMPAPSSLSPKRIKVES
jgi:HSP20 family protein